MQKEIKGQQAKFHSKLYYPIYNDYRWGSPMDYNFIWTRVNLLYVLEVTQWNFINGPEVPITHQRGKYLECRILNLDKLSKGERLSNGWKLTYRTTCNSTGLSYDILLFTLTDPLGEKKDYPILTSANGVAAFFKKLNKITSYKCLAHYKAASEFEDLQQKNINLSITIKAMQVASEKLSEENKLLNMRVQKLEGYADKVQKMTAKLKLTKVK